MKVDGNVAIIGGATVLLLVAGWYMSNKAGKAAGAVVDTVKAVAPYVNPADSRNVVYSAVNAVGALLTDDPNFDLGSWGFDKTHSAPAQPTETDDQRRARLGAGFDLKDKTGNGWEWNLEPGTVW